MNGQSLNKSFFDVMSDEHVRENETLCLTESQILPNDNIYPIETAFQSQFYVNLTAVKISSSAYPCVPRSISIL